MKAIVLGFVVLINISGCATSPVSIKDAQTVPADRILRMERLPLDGNARALFVRDEGFLGSGLYQHLYIDGKKAASLNPGEKVEFVLSPGEHIFGVIPTDPFGTTSLNSIDQDLKPGKRYFYRIKTDGNTFRTDVQRFVPETE